MAANLTNVTVSLSVSDYEYVQALLRVKKETKKTNESIQRSFKQSADSIEKSTGKSTKNFNNFAGQFGYQVQDLVVQLQQGTSAFVAIGQQGSQLLSVINPLYGLLLVVGTTIGGILAPALFGGADATKELEAAQESLNKVLAETDDGIRYVAESYQELTKENKAYADLQLNLAIAREQEALKALRAEIEENSGSLNKWYDLNVDTRDAVINSFREVQQSTTFWRENGLAVSELGANYDKLNDSFDLGLLRQVVSESIRLINEGNATPEFIEQTAALQQLLTKYEQGEINLEGLRSVMEGTALTAEDLKDVFEDLSEGFSVDEALSAQERYQNALKKYAVKNETDRLKQIDIEKQNEIDKWKDLLDEGLIYPLQYQNIVAAIEKHAEVEKEKFRKQQADKEKTENERRLAERKRQEDKARREELRAFEQNQREILEQTREFLAEEKSVRTEALSGYEGNVGLASLWNVEQLEQDYQAYQDKLLEQVLTQKITWEEYWAGLEAAEKEHNERRVEANELTTEALSTLLANSGNQLFSYAASLSGATDEEKEQLKQRFLQQQAYALAQASINYAAQLAAISLTAAEMGAAGAVYEAAEIPKATANYIANTAAIAGTTLIGGSFEKGSEYIPEDMTALVHEGERVVQKDINRDLSQFLIDQKSGDYSQQPVTINAPVNVSGNVTDQAWFSQQLMKQRDIIAAAQAKASKENLSRRR